MYLDLLFLRNESGSVFNNKSWMVSMGRFGEIWYLTNFVIKCLIGRITNYNKLQ